MTMARKDAQSVIGSFLRIAQCCALLLVSMLTHSATAATCQGATGFAWDNATPQANQTIDATEVLVDGQTVDSTTLDTYPCDDLTLSPGDYTLTVRHTGTVDGVAAFGAESNQVPFTVIAQGGVPGVAPALRFHQLDGTA